MDILETQTTLCTRHKKDKTNQTLNNEDELKTTEYRRIEQIHYTEKYTAKTENEKKQKTKKKAKKTKTKNKNKNHTTQISKKIGNTDINK